MTKKSFWSFSTTSLRRTILVVIENFRESGFFAFYNAIVKALQARGYVPEKVLSRARRKDSGNGRPDVPKGGGNGRQTRRSVNAAQAAADSGDSGDDSDTDYDDGYGFSSAGIRPLVGVALNAGRDQEDQPYPYYKLFRDGDQYGRFVLSY